MANNTLIKMKTGTITKMEQKQSNGQPVVPLDKGTVYFAVDTDAHIGKIVYDAPTSSNGTDRIVMSTQAEYADRAGSAQNVTGVVSIQNGGTGKTRIQDVRDEIQIIDSKIFTGVIGTANNWADATFFFGTVMPTAFNDLWSITYRVSAVAAGNDNAKATSVFTLNGTADTYVSYSSFNSIKNTSYRPCYYHIYYRAKQVGITNGYGHAMGLRLQSAWNPTTAANARTITIEILETKNCSFSFFDSMLKYANIPGTGSTNYNTYSEFDFANNGLQETGDSNTNYNMSVYFSGKTGAQGIWASSLFMEDGNGTYQNICTASDGTATASNRTTATTKLPNTNGFKVGGTIFYSGASYNANTNISGWGAVSTSFGNLFDSRYSLNTSLTANSLTPYKPIYLVGEVHDDGLFYLDNPWWTQTPNAEDKVYVLVGGCYDSTTQNCRISLYEHNDWYIYENGKLIPYIYSYVSKDDLGDLLAKNDAMVFKGVINQQSDIPTTQYEAGWTYKIGAFGTYADKVCEVGDLFICIKDWDANHASNNDWMVVQSNLDNGLFKGSNTFTNEHMLLADGTVGKVKSVSINPLITLTGSTSSDAPKFKFSVGGKTSNEVTLDTATTSLYGVTKLSDATNSTSTSLAATANAVKKAYDLAASKTSNVGTITGVTAGAGLTGGGTSGNVTIGHSNSIDAITTEGLYKLKWDAQGHIVGAIQQLVTDNTTNKDVTNTDTNLITGRTLYYQLAKKGYTTNTGTVTSVSSGEGLTGGPVTTTGTISHAVPTNATEGAKGGSSRTYLQTITTDKFGHITGYTTASETVTNTHYDAKNIVTNSATGKTQTTTALTNGNVYLNLLENNTIRSSHKLSGANVVGVTTDTSGNIIIGHVAPANATSGAKGGSGRTYLQTITTDAYGHITGYTTASESVTDTHHQAKGITTNANNSTTQTTSALTNGNVFYNIIENNTVRSSHKISGSNLVGVTADASGNIAISHTAPSGASATTYNSSGGTRQYIKTITTDTYGHITGVTTGSETVTDTHHQAKIITTNSTTSTTQTTSALTNGNVYLNVVENGAVRSAHKISSSAGLGVVTDTSGNIDIKHTIPTGASATTLNGSGGSRSYIKSITTDAYGHVTGFTAGSETVTNSDTKVNVVARGTTKAYLLADTTAPTNTAAAHSAVAETAVYLDTTAGKLVATSFSGSGAGLTNLNASNLSSGTVSVERFPTSPVTAGTYQGITVDQYGRVTGAVNQGYTTNTGTVTKITAGTGLNTSSDQADNATKGSITTTGTLYLTTSGVTAGSYGPSANATPAYNATFNVPYITVDKYGRVTAASTKTVKIPASDNTDTKQNIVLGTTNKAFITGVTTTPTATAQALTGVADTGVYLTTTAGELNAKQYKVDEAVTFKYNSTEKTLDFIFA